MRRLGRVALAAALGGVLLGMPAMASAVLTSTAAETNAFTAGSLATPTGLQTIHPTVTGAGDGDVRLTWTDTIPRPLTYLVQRAPAASPTSWATVNGLGSGSSSATLCTGTVPGAVSCSYDDNAANSTSAPSYNASYVYQVVSKVGGWTKPSAGGYAGSLPPTSGSETYLVPRDLNAVSAVNASSIWAVGANCTVDYYNGSTWTLQTVGGAVCPAGTNLNGVAANGGLPMIVGDAGLTFLCTGGCTTATPTWSVKPTPVGTPTLNAVSASAANSMWAVGPSCTVLFWNNVTWTAKPPPAGACAAGTTLYGVAAHGGTPIFVGAASTVFTCVAGCTATPTYFANATGAPAGTVFYATHGTNNAWAVGSGGVIAACYGANCDNSSATWTTQSSGTAATLRGVFANGNNPVDIVGDGGLILQCTASCNKATGSLWVPKVSATSTDLTAVWASNAAAMAVGKVGTITVLGGWAPIDTGLTDDLHAVSATSATTVWAVGANCTVAFYNGTVWTDQTVPPAACPPGTSLNGVDANAGLPIVVGSGGVAFICASACTAAAPVWTPMTTGTTETLNAVSAWPGKSPAQVWATGTNCTIRFWNGTTWTGQTAPPACAAGTTLYGAESNNGKPVFAGAGSTLFTCTGGCNATPTWTVNPTGVPAGTTFYAVTYISTSAVWAVGSGGAIAACTANCDRNTATWIAQSSTSSADLRAVNASTATLVDVVGTGGEILQCTSNCNKNTAIWTSQASPLTTDLTGVYVVSASKAYVVGVGGNAAGVGTGAFAVMLSTSVPVDVPRTDPLVSGDLAQLADPDGVLLAGRGPWPTTALPAGCNSPTTGLRVRPSSTVPAGTWALTRAVATVVVQTDAVPSGGAALQLLVSPDNGATWTTYPVTAPTAAGTPTLTSRDVTTALGSTAALPSTLLCLQASSGGGPTLTTSVDLMHLDVN